MSRFVDWWAKNPEKAEAIRQRRRERYRENPEKELARKRQSRAKKDQRRYPSPKTIVINEVEVEVWSVGRVADFLGVHKRTLAGLEARGAIPKNRITDKNGRRWWPAAYAEWLKPFFELRINREITAREFSYRVWNVWSTEIDSGNFVVLEEDGEKCEERNRREAGGSDGSESDQDCESIWQ